MLIHRPRKINKLALRGIDENINEDIVSYLACRQRRITSFLMQKGIWVHNINRQGNTYLIPLDFEESTSCASESHAMPVFEDAYLLPLELCVFYYI